MPLPPPATRQRLHLRQISYVGFRRDDGLYDIEAHLIDHKDHDYSLVSGTRNKDTPLHEMWARITINTHYEVVAIDTSTDEMPYRGDCDRIGPQYLQLIGTNLLRGFRKHIAEKLGGVKACTHLSELLGALPTAAIQTLAAERSKIVAVSERKPFQLDGCHALSTSGDVVRRYYPKWHVSTADKVA